MVRSQSRALVLLSLLFPAVLSAQEWTRFRGPNGEGISQAKTVPIRWTEADFNWNVELPGEGHSCPVVWKERLFLLSAEKGTAKRYVLCLSTKDGSIIWKKEYDSNLFQPHRYNSFASSSPAVDEHHVYVTWTTEPSNLLIALTHDGKEVWRRDLGPYHSQHGGGTSPIVFGELVVLANDQDGDSFLIAVDRMTGKTKWQIPRKVAPQGQSTAYSTPCVYQPKGGKPQLIFSSQVHGFTALEPETGKKIWEIDTVFDKRSVSSPLLAGDLIVGTCGSGGGGNYVVGVRPGASSPPEMVYKIDRSAPYVPTGIYQSGLLFLISDAGIATCADAKTGEIKWTERLSATFFGSPVCVNGAIYCMSREGEVIVFRAADKFELLARNPLGEPSHATPAVAGGRMYLRTMSRLISVGGK